MAKRAGVKIAHAFLETFSHVTEDASKVKEALLNVMPSEVRDKVAVLEEQALGHYGNPIIILRAELEEDLANKLAKYLGEKLDAVDKSAIKNQLDRFFNGCGNLYLKIDKQQAFMGKVALSEGDDIIKLRIGMTRFGKGESVLDYLKVIGLVQ